MDQETVVRRARAILTEAQPNVEYSLGTLRALIPMAIARLHDRKINDPGFKRNFIVETGIIPIKPGDVAEAKERLDEVSILPSELRESEIVIESDQAPEIRNVMFVEQLDRLKMGGRQDRLYIKCYVSGTRLYFQNAAAANSNDPDSIEALAGKNFKIRGVSHSSNVEILPDALEGYLALEIAALAPRPNTASPLGQNIEAGRV